MVGYRIVVIVVYQTTFRQWVSVVMTDYPVFSQTTMVAPVLVVSQSTPHKQKGRLSSPSRPLP